MFKWKSDVLNAFAIGKYLIGISISESNLIYNPFNARIVSIKKEGCVMKALSSEWHMILA